MLNKRAIFINTASQIVVRFFTLAVTLVSVKLLANFLGTKGVGEYNTITTYVNFFIVFAELGLFATTVREISKHPENEHRILANVFTIRLISAVISCFIAIGLIVIGRLYFDQYNINDHIMYGVIIASGFLLFNLLWSMYDMVLQARLKMQYSALSEFAGKIVSIVALVTIIALKGNFYAVLATITISAFVTFVLKWIFAKRYVNFCLTADSKFAKEILRISIPLGIVFILEGLYFKLDTLMLYPIKGPEAVGIYSVAYKVLEVVAFFGAYFASSLKPAISREIMKNRAGVGSIISNAIPIMIYISLPITIICVLFSREIILLVSNQSFADGSYAQNVLAFTLPFIYLNVLVGEVLIANDNRKLLLKISGAILLFNFVFNLITIPRFSYMGAAWGTLISEIILFLVFYYSARKIVELKLDWTKIFYIILISAMTFIFGMLIKQLDVNFIILILVILAAYILFSSLFKILTLGTIKELLKPESA